MRATVYRPPGQGPFPLVVVSHGSAEDPELRARFERPTFPAVASWFVKRGHMVVAPQRPGHGETGGTYLEANGDCRFPDYRAAAFATATSIEAAILFMMTWPFAQKSAVVLVGHSAGAWGSLALAVQRPGIAKAVINFSGGRGGRSANMANQNCAPDKLVDVTEQLGRGIRIPTLWLYPRNDTFFGPDLSQRMADKFRAAGGRADFHLLPPFGEDGHFFIHSPDAVRIWAPIVDKFLARIGTQ
jgi:dienelactone hydrolase